MTLKTKIILTIGVVILLLFGLITYRFLNRPGHYKMVPIILANIYDLTKKEIIKLESEGTIETINGITIYINGNINGTGTLTIGYNDSTEYQSYKMDSGKIDIEHRSDWYSGVCYLTFIPTSKANGELEIECDFVGD